MTAALIRENELLRKVAEAAMRVRRIGQQADQYEINKEELYRKDPQMPKSGTGSLMFAQAYETALKHFDEAVLEAAAAGMDWAAEHGKLGPRIVP